MIQANKFFPEIKGNFGFGCGRLPYSGKNVIANNRLLQMASERKFAEFLEGKKREYADIAGLSVEKLPEGSLKSIEREARAEFNRKGFLRDVTSALDTCRKSIAGFGSDGL